MKNKAFRFYNRSELVEIIYQLQQENQKLTEENQLLSKKLAAKELKISQAGSIAQAVVGLTDIFSKAQETADYYLAEIQRRSAQLEEEYAEKLSEVQARADEIIRSAQLSAKISTFDESPEETADPTFS